MAEPCIIGKQIVIRGNLSGSEDLVVQGRVEGAITLGNHLTVDRTGVVDANLDVDDLTVNGSVSGDIQSARGVEISAEATVVGNVKSPRIVIADGARFKGHIEMDVPLPDGIEG